ncbi:MULTISPECIES: MBL fold metallo-hydrolase [Fusobacterium]|uniref:MBL fold metallo-hydrolase n=1 Tax=Fusobacterium TaxID=848 RepID=UPI0014770BEB|nr:MULTISPECIES: MBL fold metallo-hydrolase [Fusobacterium]NME36574.1 MBL fold metallo-hydrolase [Fusobacterium sp. FSA-380-WT-3A]
MVELIYENPKIYRIFVPLPENPLKLLNSYVIITENRNLIIDTGFKREECLKALLGGLKELKLELEKTDIFLTHLHSDHCGLINKLTTDNNKVYMSEIDYDYLIGNLIGDNWKKIEERFKEEGFPNDIAFRLKESNHAKRFAPDKIFEVIKLKNEDKIQIGDTELIGIHTPGHTPGHMCLYIPKEKILFSGDHVLFDITPNITSWLEKKDSLGDYIESLKKIKKLDIKTTFPGHREIGISIYDRIDSILNHHKERLEELLEVLSKKDSQTAYEIASQMTWNTRGKGWNEFPDNQKWFATGETMSHLDYLYCRNKIEKILDKDNFYKYSIK